jgi:Na+/H+ antiporter NhaD/arsenite permease-like protein
MIMEMDSHLIIIWAAFLFTYLGLALGKMPGLRLDRAGIAWCGAVLIVAGGVMSFPDAARAINYETLGLLLGMMVVVAVLRRARFFARVATLSVKYVHTQHGFLALVIALSGVLSAILVNDVVCLALPPLILGLTRKNGWDPKPHLIALALAANIGSACTPIGNPQNMLIAEWSHISFARFLMRLVVPSILSLGLCYVLIAFVYRRSFVTALPITKTLHDVVFVKPSRRHDRLLAKSILVLVGTIMAFLAGFHLATVALVAATLLLLDRLSPRFVWREVDWSLLVMFAGLFVVVSAFETQVVHPGHWDQWPSLQRDPVGLLSLASAVVSNLVSNVPAVMLFKPIIPTLPLEMQETGWLALAMSSTFAGNFTILGSIANLIVVEIARRESVTISLWDYCKIGIPITLASLAIGIAWLWWF